MIRLLVVEDEAPSRRLLTAYLRELPGVEVVGEATLALEALDLAARLRPDAVFLDIQLPDMSGVDLARILPAPQPRLVFVTAFPEHALEAFRLGAAHYLLKPVNRVDVAQALARLFPGHTQQAAWLRIPVRAKGALRLLDPCAVEALVADLGDCLALTAMGRLRVEGTLNHWEARLGGHGFFRIHRNALVRLQAIQELRENGEIALPSATLTVSRRRMEDLSRALGIG